MVVVTTEVKKLTVEYVIEDRLGALTSVLIEISQQNVASLDV